MQDEQCNDEQCNDEQCNDEQCNESQESVASVTLTFKCVLEFLSKFFTTEFLHN